MLTPRSGYSGQAMRLIKMQYNLLPENSFLPLDINDQVFDVPFIGQNHMNLCIDAGIFMLGRWAKQPMQGLANLKY